MATLTRSVPGTEFWGDSGAFAIRAWKLSRIEAGAFHLPFVLRGIGEPGG